MTRTVILLTGIRLPPGMTAEQACREVRTSIGFGQPEVAVLYVMPDPGQAGPEEEGEPP